MGSNFVSVTINGLMELFEAIKIYDDNKTLGNYEKVKKAEYNYKNTGFNKLFEFKLNYIEENVFNIPKNVQFDFLLDVRDERSMLLNKLKNQLDYILLKLKNKKIKSLAQSIYDCSKKLVDVYIEEENNLFGTPDSGKIETEKIIANRLISFRKYVPLNLLNEIQRIKNQQKAKPSEKENF